MANVNDIPIATSGSQFPRVSSRRRFAFYAVVVGLQAGVFQEWLTASALVVGWPGAQFRGYHTLEEAAAAYHSGMAANPNPPAEHPASLVFHYAHPAAGDAEPPAGDAEPPAGNADPPAGGAELPAGNAEPPAADVPATPPSNAPASPPIPVISVPTPVVLAPTPPVSVAPHASLVPSPAFANTETVATSTSEGTTAGDLEELSSVMHSLNVQNLVRILEVGAEGRRPAIMSLSIAVRPNRRRGESRYTALVRTNDSAGHTELRLPAYESDGEDNDSEAPSASQDDFINVPSPSPASPPSPLPAPTPPSPSPSSVSAVPPSSSTELESLSDVSDVTDTVSVRGFLAGPSNAFTFPGCPSPIEVAVTTDTTVVGAPAPAPTPARAPSPPPVASGSRTRPLHSGLGGPTSSTGRFNAGRSHRRGSYLQAHIAQAHVEASPDGEQWYAIAAGFEIGVFRGPFVLMMCISSEIRDLVNGFPGARFRGFSTRAPAEAWFAHHAICA
ncbi:hypothetical protein FA95DRAFT_1574011 [Auriscalpium vulgare]|uniref:Uncharacterized protein n=1 Tax=Auriscalpium vulgare TaxID=40419 RepID=A0ACB8RLI2_9AGAM|nr:hypothetical protein FA95DRAFT_1574011 [Auriscalpium vulgare]